MFTLRRLWKNRNNWIFELSCKTDCGIAPQAVKLVTEYVAASENNRPVAPTVVDAWLPPADSLIKINVDVVWDSWSLHAVVAIVVRDANSSIVGSNARSSLRIGSILHAEFLAACVGVELAIFQGSLDILIESD